VTVARLALLVVLLAVVTGCARRAEEPPPLRLGYTPAEDTLADRGEAAQVLAGYLSRTLGRRVEIVRTSSYGPAIEAMQRGEIDLVPLGPFAYLRAHRLGVAEAIVVTGRPESGPRTYRSAIVARSDGGPSTLEALDRLAPGLRLCFADPSSNSGYLVPACLLATRGLDPQRDFARLEFARSHAVAIFNVLHGAADVAAVNDSVLRRLGDRGRIDDGRLRVLWRSDEMPTGPMTARRGLPEAVKRAVRDALVALPQADPQAWRAAMSAMSEPGLVYLPAGHELYAELERLAESIAPASEDAGAETARALGSSRNVRRPSTQTARTTAW